MNIALIQCPAWLTYSPPHGLSLLSADLKNNGHIIHCFDLNYLIYKKASDSEFGLLVKRYWDTAFINEMWDNLENVKSVFNLCTKEIEEFLKCLSSVQPDIIGLSVFSTSGYFSFLLTQKIKIALPHAKIFWGGPECFESFGRIDYILEKVPEIDILFTGYSCGILSEVVNYYERNNTLPASSDAYITNNENYASDKLLTDMCFDDIPKADTQCFNFTEYNLEYFPVWVTKGCVNRCSFCHECKTNKKYLWRNPQKIANEIVYFQKVFPKIEYFWLTSSNIGGNLIQLVELCNVFIDKTPSIKWVSQLAIHEKLTYGLFSLLKSSGCTCLYFGVESGSNRVLRLMNKPIDKKTIKNVLNSVAKAGIKFNFNLIVGFPGETISDFIHTLFLIHKFKRFGISPSVATCKIIPGSRLYKFPEKFNVLNYKDENWLTTDYKNTLEIRTERKRIAEYMYRSNFLNIFDIPYQLFLYWSFYRNNKAKNVKHLMAEPVGVLSKLIYCISFLPFLLWIGFIIGKMKILEIKVMKKLTNR